MGKYRNYSDDDKAVALAMYEATGNLRQTARHCDVPVTTLRLWLRQVETGAASAPSAECVHEKKRDLADLFEDVAYRACESAVGKLEDASFSQTMIGAGIAVDKARLLRDQPTVIQQQAPDLESMHKEELIAYLVGHLRAGHGPGAVIDAEPVVEGYLLPPA